MTSSILIGFNTVIVAVTEEVPRIITVQCNQRLPTLVGEVIEGYSLEALLFGLLKPRCDRTLDLALRNSVREQSGIELGYVEQLYTFADQYRDPLETQGGPRVVSVAYLALMKERLPSGSAVRWRDWYGFFPWEDWRSGRPALIDQQIAPCAQRWIDSGPKQTTREKRRERFEIAFGFGGAAWNGERVLERYELVYELGLVAEAHHDRRRKREVVLTKGQFQTVAENVPLGRPMRHDHRRILSTALGRIRGKLRYRPVVFELLPTTFTLLQLQCVVEALAGVRLHKQNFRRLVEKGGLVEGTGLVDRQTGGRPAELFQFRREVLWERPAPGVGLPGVAYRSGERG